MSIAGCLTRGCLPLFALPFLVAGAWLGYTRVDDARGLAAVRAHVQTSTLAGVTGPVRLVGTLEAERPHTTTTGEPAAMARITHRRVERGGGLAGCERTADGLSLRLANGEKVALAALVQAPRSIDEIVLGDRTQPAVKVLTSQIRYRTLDEAPRDCARPTYLHGRVVVAEEVFPLDRAVVLACASGGAVAPCGDGVDSIVLGDDLAPMARALVRDREGTVIKALVHLVLFTVLGFAALLALPSRRTSKVSTEVVRP